MVESNKVTKNKYIVISKTTAQAVAYGVSKALEDGYELHGTMFHTVGEIEYTDKKGQITFHQALVLKSESQ